MKARSFEADKPPMTTTFALLLSASFALAGFARNTKSTVQGTVFGWISISVEVIQLHIGNLNLRLSMDLIIAHYAEF